MGFLAEQIIFEQEIILQLFKVECAEIKNKLDKISNFNDFFSGISKDLLSTYQCF